MKAFVVDKKTINRIVHTLHFLQRGALSDYFVCEPLEKLGYDLTERQDLERLGRDMFALNIRSVNQRDRKSVV